MSLLVSTRGDDYLTECASINRVVSEKVRKSVGVNPRTKIAGYAETFSVEMSSGKVYVAVVEPSAVEGYLAHENGHRSAFPVTSAGSMAFMVAIKALAPTADNDAVVAAANVVADAFSDTVLLWSGLGKTLSKRVPSFLSRIDDLSPLLAFKSIVYKAIEIASAKGAKSIDAEELKVASEDIAKLFPQRSGVVNMVFPLVSSFVAETNKLLSSVHPRRISEYLLNPYDELPYNLRYLADVAASLLNIEQQTQRSSGQSCDRGGSSSQQGQQQQGRGSATGSGSTRAERSVGGSKSENKVDVERGDIEPGDIDPTDVHKALLIAHKGFGISAERAAVAIDLLFSRKVKESVKKLLEKIRLLYVQQDRRATTPSGFRKEVTDLWLHPFGEPDEDSVLKEKHKLLWKVEYKVPLPRGRLADSPAGVPEKVVLVMDESGSTLSGFGSSTVISVESLVSMLVVAGLRYRGGAKEVTVVKFSDSARKTYEGRDVVAACTNVVIPHDCAGGGTNIGRAVDVGILEATKNSALVVVTDLEISDEEADEIGKKLKNAVDSGKVGFVVFVIVNERVIESALDIIRGYLSGRNSLVARIASVDDLENLGNTIISRILSMGRR